MVPDYSSCANSKSEEFANSSDCPFGSQQTASKSVRFSRIRHSQLNAPHGHQLPATAAYVRPWRLYGSFTRLTAFRCLYRQTRPFVSVLRSQLDRSTRITTIRTMGHAVAVRWNAGRADRLSFSSTKQQDAQSTAIYLRCEHLRVKVKRVSSSAAEIIILAAYHAHDRGVSQPALHDLELSFHRPFRASTSRITFQQCSKCKQPPQPDGCLVAVCDTQAVFCQFSTGTLT